MREFSCELSDLKIGLETPAMVDGHVCVSLKVHVFKLRLLKDLQLFALTCKCLHRLIWKWLNLTLCFILS